MPWKFTKPTAGKIAVTLDNNVWNLLFEKEIDLTLELSPKEFAVFITREVEIEAFAIPITASKAGLKDYIARTTTLGFASQ